MGKGLTSSVFSSPPFLQMRGCLLFFVTLALNCSHARGGSLFGANPSQGQLGRQKVAALVSVPLRGQHAGCWTGRSWESSAWCSRDPASAHPTQDLGLCGLPAHAHMVSFPRSPSVWRDGSFDCQIQEGKAHKIHKCIVACVIFAQLQLTVTEMWALGPIFAV